MRWLLGALGSVPALLCFTTSPLGLAGPMWEGPDFGSGGGLGGPSLSEEGNCTAAHMVAAGVPAESAEGVCSLASTVGARGTEPLADPLSLLRFFEHRSGDIDAAAEMYRETMSWRASYPVQAAMAAYGVGEDYHPDGSRVSHAEHWSWQWSPSTPEAQRAAQHRFFGRLTQPADDGGPVLVWRVGIADYGGFVREGLVEEMIRAFVAHFEDALQTGRAASLKARRLVRARVIADAYGFGLENLQYLGVLRRIVSLVEDHFPEITMSVIVVRAPWSVVTLYSIVRPWLTKHVQEKVYIFGEDFENGLREHSGLKLSAMPRCLGGEASDGEAGLALQVPLAVAYA